MSAYMVDKAHIDALVDAGLRFHRGGYGGHSPLSWYVPGTEHNPARRTLTRETANLAGQRLQDANVRSVHARYPDCDPDNGGNPDHTPGPIARYYEQPYQYPGSGPAFSPTELLHALRGYQYQACESADWDTSEAFAFCQALQQWLIRALPGYDDGPWAITAETRPLAQVTAHA